MAARGEPKLTDVARAFVVQQLAMFDAPSIVVASVKQEFGITVSAQAVEFYDPTKRAGEKCHEKWKSLFRETRAAFIESTAQIGISHKAVRLRTLQRLAEKAEKQGAVTIVAQLNEQAAKEMGNAYTNTRVLAGGLEITAPKSLADFYANAPHGGSDT